MMLLASQLLASLLLVTQASAQLTKPLIQPPFNGLGDALQQNLKKPSYSYSKWPWGQIPLRCKAVAEKENYSPYDVEVYDVTYSDCPQKWILCRHNQAPTGRDNMFDRFGRLPVGVRDYVRHFILMPTRSSRGGYTYWDLGDSVIVGDAHGSDAQALWVHEVSHTLDYHHGRFSGSQTWVDAYNRDSAISDGYAQNNQIENFAQEAVIAMYDNIVPGGVAAVQPSWRTIWNQVTAVKNVLGDIIKRDDNRVCKRGVAVGLSDTIVCMGPAAEATCASQTGGARMVRAAARRGVANVPTVDEAGLVNCTFDHLKEVPW